MTQPAPPQDAVSVIAAEFSTDSPCPVSIDVPGAVTTLQANSRTDQTEVEISISDCGRDEAQHILDRMGLEADRADDTIQIHSDADRSDATWWRWIRTLEATVHVALHVSSRIHLDLNAPAGDVHLSGLEGHFELDVMGGRCALENLDGMLDLQAESSTVSIDQFSGETLAAHVAAGTLSVRDVQSNTVALRSVDAPLTLDNVDGDLDVTANSTSVTLTNIGGPCTAENQGGPLTYKGPPDADTDLTVVGAPLNVHLPANHAADLAMVGPNLSLDADFSFDGERTKNTIEGTLSGGGPALNLRSVCGTAECMTSE